MSEFGFGAPDYRAARSWAAVDILDTSKCAAGDSITFSATGDSINFLGGPGKCADATLTVAAGNASGATFTITVGTTAYTVTRSDVSAAATATAIVTAINANVVDAHAMISSTDTVVIVMAKNSGTAGNSIALTSSDGNVTASAATLSNGSDNEARVALVTDAAASFPGVAAATDAYIGDSPTPAELARRIAHAANNIAGQDGASWLLCGNGTRILKDGILIGAGLSSVAGSGSSTVYFLTRVPGPWAFEITIKLSSSQTESANQPWHITEAWGPAATGKPETLPKAQTVTAYFENGALESTIFRYGQKKASSLAALPTHQKTDLAIIKAPALVYPPWLSGSWAWMQYHSTYSDSTKYGADRYDWGLGDYNPTSTWAVEASWDTGFGSPYHFMQNPPVIIPEKEYTFTPPTVSKALVKYPDSGGVRVTLFQGSWPKLPYKVWLTASGTAQKYPTGTDTYCESGKSGQGSTIYPTLSGNYIRFILPVLPPGRYNIHIRADKDPEGLLPAEIVLTNVLAITRRARTQFAYRIRGKLPTHFKSGSSRFSAELFRLGGTK